MRQVKHRNSIHGLLLFSSAVAATGNAPGAATLAPLVEAFGGAACWGRAS